MSAAIQLDRVGVVREGRPVLADVSLSVAPGETLPLLGSSGCGKTTLLRVVAGFLAPTSGTVRVGGAVAARDGRSLLPPEERELAMVFQDLALWPHLTVHGNLAFGLAGKKVPRGERDDRIASILARVGLSGKDRRHPGELSGGERQRVAIARALAVDPPLLMMDEPTASLDTARRDALGGLLRRLCGENRSILVSTHDEGFAQEWATEVLYLREGRIT